MKATDKAVLLALPVIGLLAIFWFLALSPRREEAAKLQEEIERLSVSVAVQQEAAAAGEAARKSFPADYRRVVVLGKAVPEGADTPSLLVQLNRVALGSGVGLGAISLSEASGTEAVTTTTPESNAGTAEAGGSAPPVAVPATEASVSSLPIGATTGPAGLPVMPYELTLNGDFFGFSEFIGELDSLVGVRRDGRPSVSGRLITVDGFTLEPAGSEVSGTDASGKLAATFAVTTFLTPAQQGLTAGATPAGPAPTVPQPVSSTATSSAPPAAAVSLGGGSR